MGGQEASIGTDCHKRELAGVKQEERREQAGEADGQRLMREEGARGPL